MTSHHDLANAVRMLAVDAVEAAQSGHPGMPMGMADIATVLWRKHLNHNPQRPDWWNRDRFVLSNGHGAMLQYALLHLSGYDLGIDELERFRQWQSKTPGHPEHGHTPGVETTTGPLGQGLANAVGMALAESMLAAQFNKDKYNIIDHYTYVFAGDGCMMEGVSHEACALAATWGLGKLVVFYDDNGISIDGPIESWMSESVAQRFAAYGWHVSEPIDGHDPEAIDAAILAAQAELGRPSLVVCRTNIGHGSPNLVGQAKTHGAPLGGDEIAEMRAHLSWPHVPFELPDSIKNAWDLSKEGQDKMHEWMSKFDEYSVKYPDLSKELRRRKGAMLPDDWQERVAAWQVKLDPAGKDRATRQSSQDFLNHLAPHLPEIVGGSADLTPSNLTQWTAATVRSKQHPGGQYVHYGVREFGMAGIMNGLAVYGGFIPFGGTFLTFVDYMRNAVRLAAMMKQRVIYVLTHDSIGLGEDGPTHQPVEHIGMLRMTPNLHNWRPADALETAVAWQMAIEQRNGPTTLLLSRQKCPALDRCDVAGDKVEAIQRGGYCLRRHPKPDVLLMATGSEVSIICRAADTLQQRGVAAQVVSMPCVELFLEQPAEYQDEVLPPTVTRRVAMEAASSLPWYRFVGSAGHVLGLDHYGASAPAAELYEQFGFTAERVVDVVLQYRQQQSTVN